MPEWISQNIIEITGALTGILYVFLEIRQNILLWPLGILTSVFYMIVFRTNGFYAGMILQVYYLVVSIYGWWHWQHKPEPNGSVVMTIDTDTGERTSSDKGSGMLRIRNLDMKTGLLCLASAILLFFALWIVLDRFTDSPVPEWDGLITSLSVVATWMLTRKILEQWYVWIVANAIAVLVYFFNEMYPTAILFLVYLAMAVIGAGVWRKEISNESSLR